jgi:putative transposase
MPRPPRPILPGQPLHIIQRGNNRTVCFGCDDDRQFYLRALQNTSRRAGCAIHAYALMTNHVHLLATATQESSAVRMMQMLGGRYVRYFNDRYERTGTLWEGRYRSSIIDSERYFLLCSRYIETNPVRAGMVTHAEDFRWSSFRFNAYGQTDDLVTPHDIYLALAPLPSSRQAAYRELFSSTLGQNELRAIRCAINANASLGAGTLRATFESKYRRSMRGVGHGGA